VSVQETEDCTTFKRAACSAFLLQFAFCVLLLAIIWFS